MPAKLTFDMRPEEHSNLWRVWKMVKDSRLPGGGAYIEPVSEPMGRDKARELVLRLTKTGERVINRATATVPNPSIRGALRAVNITDRAQRYRAQAAIEQPERRCIYCGAPETSRRRLDVEHINGREADNAPENLGYACRPCNTEKGAHFARARLGRKTAQFNPRTQEGARTWQQWTRAVLAAKGYQTGMDARDAIAMIRATPPRRRSEFAAEIYAERRARGHAPESAPF